MPFPLPGTHSLPPLHLANSSSSLQNHLKHPIFGEFFFYDSMLDSFAEQSYLLPYDMSMAKKNKKKVLAIPQPLLWCEQSCSSGTYRFSPFLNFHRSVSQHLTESSFRDASHCLAVVEHMRVCRTKASCRQELWFILDHPHAQH